MQGPTKIYDGLPLSGRTTRRLFRQQRTVAASVTLATAIACGGILLMGAGTVFASQPTVSAANKAVTVHTLKLHKAAQDFASRETNNDVTLDFVAADINDVLKALAVQTGANIVSSADVKGTITVSLAHVTLEQALDMVTRLSGYQYAKANNAYIVGTPSGIAQFAASPVNAAQVTEVVALRYATVDDVSGLVKARYPSVQISSGTQIAGQSVGTTSSAIVISGPQDEVDQVKGLISSFEDSLQQRVSQDSTETYTPKYAALGDLIGVLNTLVPSLLVTPGPGLAFHATAPSASAGAASSSASSSGSSSSSSGAPASGATGTSQTSLTGPSVLLLTGTAGDIKRGRDILAKVDLKPAQLLYETKVTEINDTDQKNIGLNWNFSTASVSIGELVPTGYVAGATVNPVPYPGSITKFGEFGRSPLLDLATITLDALIQTGKGKLLADPNIAAVDGFPAQVFIGDTDNYIQSITTSTTGENITTATVQVGVTLRVTGKMNDDGYITLNIHPEVSTISNYTSTPGGGELPDIATRYADTTVRVKDGQTIAIGGLIQDNDIKNVSKVPFFGDLPFFSSLFKDSQHSKAKTEVIFFLKTSVLKD